MITARRKNDLYENISDEYLELRNSIRAKSQLGGQKCKSVPSIVEDVTAEETHYDVPPLQLQRRNEWSYGSFQNAALSVRNCDSRRSMSALEEKENRLPCHNATSSSISTLPHPPPRALAQRVPEKPPHLRLQPINTNQHYDVPRRVINTTNYCNRPSGLQLKNY